LATQTYYLTSGPITQSWTYPLFTFTGLANQDTCVNALTYSASGYTVDSPTLKLTPTYSNAAMAVGHTLTNTLIATFVDTSQLCAGCTISISAPFTVVIQDNCLSPVTSPLPTNEYKLISSTIIQTWSFTKFTFPNAFLQSNCYDSLTYSSPDGYTIA
jgi:hypothetical protein